MEENLHKDNLEEFFKNSFENENIDPSDDQWDVPSDDVWSGINNSINPVNTPNPAPVLNIKTFLAVAAGILLLGLVYYNYTLQNQISELNQIIENQVNTIEKLEKMVLENGMTEDGEGKDGKTENGMTEDGGWSEEFSNTVFENEGSKTTEKSSSQSNSKVTSNQNNSQENNSKEQNGSTNKSQNNPNFAVPPVDKSNKKKDIAEGGLKTGKSSNLTTNNDSNAKDSQLKSSNLKQEKPTNNPSNSSELLENSITVLTPLASKMIYAESNSQDEEITLGLLPVPEIPGSPSFKAGFYVGAHIAPTYTYRNIKSVDGPVLRRLLNDQETATYSVGIGLKAGYQFSKNWSVETGLNYYKNTIQAMHRAQIRYESQIERLNSDGNYDSNYQLNLTTSYGEIVTDVAITRNSDTQIDQNDYINLVLKTQQELKYLGVPIAVRFRTAGNKFHFSAKAGFSTNFILQKEVIVKAAVVNRDGIHHRRTLIDKKFTGLKNTTIDVLFGLGVDYDVSKNLSIYFEPTITRSLSPVYQIRGKIKTYPIVTALNIGLSYRF
jgi:Outer membrane protein beta-barrel domain